MISKSPAAPKALALNKGDSIVIIGSGMASRMNHFGHFETELQLRFPKHNLTIRNMGDEGNTPAFRPRLRGVTKPSSMPSRARKAYVKPEHQVNSNPVGHFETPDQWISGGWALNKGDVIIVLAFFGHFNSSSQHRRDDTRGALQKGSMDAFLAAHKHVDSL